MALVPLMIDAQAPGKEILHPVAITIFGGLLTATVLDRTIRRISDWRQDADPVLPQAPIHQTQETTA